MARNINKLSARTVETLKAPGRYSDGGNLYLSISANGGRRWVFMYRFAGRQREMGLGSASRAGTSLARARELAAEARTALAAGRDPLEARKATRQADRVVPSFGECADAYVETHRKSWRNDKHVAQWTMTLTSYCAPIRTMPVNEVDTEAVLKVLQPIWDRLPETAKRLRGRIEKVLDAAAVRGFRTGENPARWRGHLQNLLAKPKVLTRGHHAALPYEKLPEFVAQLRARHSVAAQALEFAILTACRSGEVCGARWEEIDLDKAVWVIPAKPHEGRQGAPRATIRPSRHHSHGPEGDAHQRLCLSWHSAWQAAIGDGDGHAAAAHEGGRHHRSWLSLHLQGLGERNHVVPARGLRASAGAYHRQQDRSRL